MTYTINETREFGADPEAVQTAALGAVEGLEGQVTAQNAGSIEAKFHKTIHGRVLGDRTQFTVTITTAADGGSQVAVTAFPIDAVGRELKFGARKGVTRTVLNWYWAHLAHRLGDGSVNDE